MKGQLFLPESTFSVDSNMTFDRLLKAFQDHESITGTVTRLYSQTNTLEVDLGGGLMGSLPIDEFTIYPIYREYTQELSPNVSMLIGETIRARIIDINGPENIVLSRKENMQEALEYFKQKFICEQKTIIEGQITFFLRCNTFVDIGAGIHGIIKPINFSKWFIYNARDIGFKEKDVIPVSFIKFDERQNSFELARITNPTYDYSLDVNDIVICKVLEKVTNDPSGEGYYVIFNQSVYGILDSNIKLSYGDEVTAIVKKITEKGVKFTMVKKL